jgi:hypothetical protein
MKRKQLSLIVVFFSIHIPILPSINPTANAEDFETIAITRNGGTSSSGSARQRTITSSRDLMRAMPASLKPKGGKDWSRDDTNNINNWLGTKKGIPFQATLKVDKVDIGEASYSQKREQDNDKLWRATVFFEPRNISYLGVTIVKTVDPIHLFGNENYARAAQRLRKGAGVCVKGTTEKYGIRSDSVKAKWELLTIYLENADVLSSVIPKALLKLPSKSERNQSAPGWTARQKQGNFWVKGDLGAFKPSVSKSTLTITHTQEHGGWLTYDKRQLRGDFTVIATASGTGHVGIVDTSAIEGSNIRVAINSTKPVTIRINRTGKTITFTVNGKDMQPTKGFRANLETTQLFVVAVPKEQTLKLHSVKMTK